MTIKAQTDTDHVDTGDLESVDPVPTGELEGESSWLPTRKWWAASTGAVASIAASWIVTGAFDDVERGMAGAALVSLVAAYWQPNQPTPGGVPEA